MPAAPTRPCLKRGLREPDLCTELLLPGESAPLRATARASSLRRVVSCRGVRSSRDISSGDSDFEFRLSVSIFPKVKGREKRSLASHLSGYIPPKRGQAAASPAPPTGEPPPRADDGVLSSVAVFTLG